MHEYLITFKLKTKGFFGVDSYTGKIPLTVPRKIKLKDIEVLEEDIYEGAGFSRKGEVDITNIMYLGETEADNGEVLNNNGRD